MDLEQIGEAALFGPPGSIIANSEHIFVRKAAAMKCTVIPCYNSMLPHRYIALTSNEYYDW